MYDISFEGGIILNIDEEIKSYISSKETNGALLLTGKWGSGKTYIIREISQQINKGKDYAVVIVSLFGVENIEELNRKVKESTLQIKLNKDISVSSKQRFSQIKNITSILSEYSKIAKGINAALSINLYDFIRIENTVECYCDDFIVKKSLILVFDDFERSKIDTVILLGALNEYTENRAIKTILIADEEKISSDEYSDFKEKLIFRTIKLKPLYSSIINSIISKYCETSKGYSEFLNANRTLIERVFSESGLENIRSLKSMIINFERVYSCWLESDIATDNMENVLYTFGAVLFEYRAGNYKESEYGYLFSDTKLKDKYSRFGANASQLLSLQNWIITGEWDEKSLVDEIKSKYGIENISEDKQFLLYNFWDLNSVIVSKGLPIVTERAYHGDLSCDELISLLQKVQALNEYGISLPLNIDYTKMVDGLDLREKLIKEGKLVEPENHTFIMQETVSKMAEEAITLYRKIERFEERIFAWKNRLEFIDYVKQISRISRYNLEGKCIVSFDDVLLDVFIKQYGTCGNYEKRELALSLTKLCFNDSRFSDSSDILESKKGFIELKSKLESLNNLEEDEISKAITREFIKLVNELISKVDAKQIV